MMIHTVEKGETLGKVAHKYFGSYRQWATLAEYNDLVRPDLIHPGDRIRIPPWEPRVFRYPMDKITTDYYKFGDLYITGQWADRPHPGVDFHEAEGAPVYPIGEGIVCRNRLDLTGYGWYMMIEHRLTDGRPVWSLYAHLEDPSLWEEGMLIREHRDPLSWEGSTGAAGVPHLHFEIKRTPDLGLYPKLTLHNLIDYYYDPYLFLSNSDYRFLPVQCWGCSKGVCGE